MVKVRSRNAPLLGSNQARGRVALLVTGGLVALSGALPPVAGSSSITLNQPFRVVVVVWMSIAAVAMFATAWWSFGRSDHTYMPFVAVLVAELAGLFAIVALLYPMILPPDLTVAEAASPSSSLIFLLGGFGLFVPLTAAYNLYAFWTLRPNRGHPNSPPSPSVVRDVAPATQGDGP
jgi:cytochrome d ubiquinol oxidase subunit II